MGQKTSDKPILILGAGISGLLLAQYLGRTKVPFQIFERDQDLDTRGLGWGLTLHWSLPALRSLLPEELIDRLPETYVDRAAVKEGRASRFPFYDLSTGKLAASTPPAPESARIRVSREKFKRLLATGVGIQWGRAANRFDSHDDGSVMVRFDDGSTAEGSLVVACDGASSRIRRQLFPELPNFQTPVRLIGAKLDVSAADIEPLRQLDPYFLQGTASENESYMYFSVLDAPGNNSSNNNGNYSCQVVVSWPIREGFFGSAEPIPVPETDEGRIALMKRFASTWAEPFRSLVLNIPPETQTKHLNLSDWPPPADLRTTGPVALIGDTLHPMAMYRGEGANHAVVDVLDFVEIVLAQLTADGDGDVRGALDRYEDKVVARTRPGVLASRQACLDAHDWSRINAQSPLLSRRSPNLQFDESAMYSW